MISLVITIVLGLLLGWFFQAWRYAKRDLRKAIAERDENLRYWIVQRDSWRSIAERAIEREARTHHEEKRMPN